MYENSFLVPLPVVLSIITRCLFLAIIFLGKMKNEKKCSRIYLINEYNIMDDMNRNEVFAISMTSILLLLAFGNIVWTIQKNATLNPSTNTQSSSSSSGEEKGEDEGEHGDDDEGHDDGGFNNGGSDFEDRDDFEDDDDD